LFARRREGAKRKFHAEARRREVDHVAAEGGGTIGIAYALRVFASSRE